MKATKILSLLGIIVLVLSLFTGCSNSDSGTPANTNTLSVSGSDTLTEPDDDAYEEGTSETDNIVNTTAADKVILVVSFGTSFNQSRSLAIGGIETAIQNAYPDYQVRRAFTSHVIIDKLAERDNLNIDNVEDAMNRLVLDKVKEVVIQPTHIMSGYEYNDMISEVMPFADKFESFKIGKPLLTDDADYDEVAELIVNETSGFRADDTAIVFMGHGTEHEAGAAYTKLQDIMTAKGYNDYVIGTVEPGIEIGDVQEMLSTMDVTKVVLRPLMVVAGDHANNDMAGDEEDSWKVVLTEDGYTVETVLEGLGQIKGIQDIYIRHIQDAISSTSLSVTPTANAVGVTAGRIKNGSYSIEVDSDTSMFRIEDCQLTVEDNGMTAVITLSGQGYETLYMGTVEQALADSEDNHHRFTLVGERHTFTIPVAALDIAIDCAALGTRSGNWYDHTIVFKSANIPYDSFIPCEVDVEMVGGTGRASIQSPATLTYKDGIDIAEIVWSSSNYTYMLVDGVEYLPVNTDGNSTFEIPVVLDADMTVVACTVAMSEPKEIEYVLRFDSSSVK